MAFRPGDSETAPIRSADINRDEDERKLLLLVRDQTLVEQLRRSLQRKNIWCAPCPRPRDLSSLLRVIDFDGVVMDFDDDILDAHGALPTLELHDQPLMKIGLTRILRLRSELEAVVDRVLLQPLDISELIRAVSTLSLERQPPPRPKRDSGEFGVLR